MAGPEQRGNDGCLVLNRDTLGNGFFLRTEITLKGATYQISFTDAELLPPPFRIHNMSEVRFCECKHLCANYRLDINMDVDCP